MNFVQEQLQTNMNELGELISRTRSRIVQSPDRLKRKISDMAATVSEDKQTFAMHEAKIRDLQVKSAALVAIEKVRLCPV
jgi:kinetochore protein Nuf2